MMFKAGILSGRFYIWAAANFAASIVMPLVPQVSILLFGRGLGVVVLRAGAEVLSPAEGARVA